MGEEVVWDYYSGVYRVRGLSLARAMGDKSAKPAVSAEVEIKSFISDPAAVDDEFIVLASDGLWDVMSSQEVVSFVHKTLNAPLKNKRKITQLPQEKRNQIQNQRKNKMGRFLANRAYAKGSGDNICVIVVWLDNELGY